MLLHNIKRFLSGSVLVLFCSMSNDALSAAHQSGGARHLNGVDVDGNAITWVDGADLPPDQRKMIEGYQGSGALKFAVGSDWFCTAKMEADSVSILGNRRYVTYSEDKLKNILFAKNVDDFYVGAHEMSHCLNHGDAASAPIIEMLENPDFKQYSVPLDMLDRSIFEVYADLSAVMQGASFTGDWTVFTDGVMRSRSGMPDALHLTSNAVSTIIASIDPKSLKGQTFSQINATANDEFKKAFFDVNGQLSFSSVGVVRIMQEMKFYANKLESYAEIPGVPRGTSQRLRSEARSVNDFSSRFFPGLSVKADDFAFLTALQIIDARQQQSLAMSSTTHSGEGKALIQQIIDAMDGRQNTSRYSYNRMSGGDKKTLDLLEKKIAVIDSWVQNSRSDASADMLKGNLSTIFLENSSQGEFPKKGVVEAWAKSSKAGKQNSEKIRMNENSL